MNTLLLKERVIPLDIIHLLGQQVTEKKWIILFVRTLSSAWCFIAPGTVQK